SFHRPNEADVPLLRVADRDQRIREREGRLAPVQGQQRRTLPNRLSPQTSDRRLQSFVLLVALCRLVKRRVCRCEALNGLVSTPDGSPFREAQRGVCEV